MSSDNFWSSSYYPAGVAPRSAPYIPPGSLTPAMFAYFRLRDLTDATITSPAVNDILKWNGSAWINVPGPTIDFVLSPPVLDNQVLQYDFGSDTWTNQTLGLQNDLPADVAMDNSETLRPDGYVLTWDFAAKKWKDKPPAGGGTGDVLLGGQPMGTGNEFVLGPTNPDAGETALWYAPGGRFTLSQGTVGSPYILDVTGDRAPSEDPSPDVIITAQYVGSLLASGSHRLILKGTDNNASAPGGNVEVVTGSSDVLTGALALHSQNTGAPGSVSGAVSLVSGVADASGGAFVGTGQGATTTGQVVVQSGDLTGAATTGTGPLLITSGNIPPGSGATSGTVEVTSGRADTAGQRGNVLLSLHDATTARTVTLQMDAATDLALIKDVTPGDYLTRIETVGDDNALVTRGYARTLALSLGYGKLVAIWSDSGPTTVTIAAQGSDVLYTGGSLQPQPQPFWDTAATNATFQLGPPSTQYGTGNSAIIRLVVYANVKTATVVAGDIVRMTLNKNGSPQWSRQVWWPVTTTGDKVTVVVELVDNYTLGADTAQVAFANLTSATDIEVEQFFMLAFALSVN